VEEIRLNRENRKIEMIKSTKEIFSKNQIPLYVQLQKQYEEEGAMRELEEHKRKLQSIRDIHKPLSHKDILRH